MTNRTKILTIFISVILIIGLIYFLDNFTLPTQADSDDNVSGWAWSENVGWISFNCSNPEISECGSSNYGVNIDPVTGELSGYAYYDIDDPSTGVHETGWISFNRADTGTPPMPPFNGTEDFIAKVDDHNKIKGWARALSACDSIPCTSSGPCSNCGGWDGWIRFDHGKPGEVYIDENGDFHGWAWSDKVIGWISFNSRNCDSDGDGFSDGPPTVPAGCPPAGTPIPAYKVSVEISNQPPVADATSNGNNIVTINPGDSVPLHTDIDGNGDGKGSYDPDGSIVTYEWDWTSDGVYDFSCTAPAVNCNTSHIYNNSAVARLRVTDNDGATAIDTVTIQVTAAPGCGNNVIEGDEECEVGPDKLFLTGDDINCPNKCKSDCTCKKWWKWWEVTPK